MRLKNLFTLLFTCLAFATSAQSLKWEHVTPLGVSSRISDGFGALAYLSYPSDDVMRTTWVDASGRTILTNDWQLGPNGGGAWAFVRFSRTELALQLFRAGQEERTTNVLRRFRKTKSGVAVTDKPLGLEENFQNLQAPLNDLKGFFTQTPTNSGRIIFRRYSN